MIARKIPHSGTPMVYHRWQERDTDNENEFTLSLCQWLSLASLSDHYIIDTCLSVFVCVGLRLIQYFFVSSCFRDSS
jgi:hypothetical protein